MATRERGEEPIGGDRSTKKQKSTVSLQYSLTQDTHENRARAIKQGGRKNAKESRKKWKKPFCQGLKNSTRGGT